MAKYHYYRVFRQDSVLRKYMPHTAICTPRSLSAFLKQYQLVYVKPNVGGRGQGVAKVWKEGNRYGYVMEKGKTVWCESAREVYKKLRLAVLKRHVVQQGINIATHQNRPFDMRIMMVRNADKRWRYVGMLAKIAGTGSVITNVNRGGGYAIKAETALSGFPEVKRRRIIQEMIRLAYRCNRMFDRIRYEWQMGYDVGVDRNGRIWLIEANPGNPSHALFAKLSDKSMYRAIKRAVATYRKRL